MIVQHIVTRAIAYESSSSKVLHHLIKRTNHQALNSMRSYNQLRSPLLNQSAYRLHDLINPINDIMVDTFVALFIEDFVPHPFINNNAYTGF